MQKKVYRKPYYSYKAHDKENYLKNTIELNKMYL